ncbi:hypothetical protein ACLOJK_027599 [Asimina triloba]
MIGVGAAATADLGRRTGSNPQEGRKFRRRRWGRRLSLIDAFSLSFERLKRGTKQSELALLSPILMGFRSGIVAADARYRRSPVQTLPPIPWSNAASLQKSSAAAFENESCQFEMGCLESAAMADYF